MGSISIILRKEPYGTTDAAEAIRHALGGVTEEMEVHLLLVDGGVNAAIRRQDTASTGFVNIGEGIGDCIDMDVGVSVDRKSAMEAGLEQHDLVDGVKLVDRSEIAALIKATDTIMIF
jgi:sulfur relay (sulfurtransferase) DsrF/TusC family protein